MNTIIIVNADFQLLVNENNATIDICDQLWENSPLREQFDFSDKCF